MLKSGETRDKGAAAGENLELNNTSPRNADVSIRRFKACTPLDLPSIDLLPFIGNALDFRGGGRSSVFRAALPFENSLHHFGNQEAIEHLHERRRCKSGNAEIRRPMQRILEQQVFIVGVGLRILGEVHDQVWNRFGVRRKVKSRATRVARSGTVDKVGHKLFGLTLILAKAPNHRTIGDMRKSWSQMLLAV